jgi:hypothetical protein
MDGDVESNSWLQWVRCGSLKEKAAQSTGMLQPVQLDAFLLELVAKAPAPQ